LDGRPTDAESGADEMRRQRPRAEFGFGSGYGAAMRKATWVRIKASVVLGLLAVLLVSAGLWHYGGADLRVSAALADLRPRSRWPAWLRGPMGRMPKDREVDLGRLVRKLVAIGPRAEARLLNAVGDPNWAVRYACVAALGEVGSEESVAPLRETTLRDPDDTVRLEAVAALAKMDGAAALQALTSVLADEDENKGVRNEWH